MSQNDRLAKIAQQINNSSLFTGTSDADRFLHKQFLFLAVAGQKPVSQIASGHWQKTATGRITVPDDVTKTKEFLDQLPLAYHIQIESFALSIWVATDQVTLDQTLKTTDNYEIGLLLGYPETAVHTLCYSKETLLPLAEQEKLLRQEVSDEQLLNLVCFRMSRQHYRTEFKTVKRWYEVLQQYGLVSAAPLISYRD